MPPSQGHLGTCERTLRRVLCLVYLVEDAVGQRALYASQLKLEVNALLNGFRLRSHHYCDDVSNLTQAFLSLGRSISDSGFNFSDLMSCSPMLPADKQKPFVHRVMDALETLFPSCAELFRAEFEPMRDLFTVGSSGNLSATNSMVVGGTTNALPPAPTTPALTPILFPTNSEPANEAEHPAAQPIQLCPSGTTEPYNCPFPPVQRASVDDRSRSFSGKGKATGSRKESTVSNKSAGKPGMTRSSRAASRVSVDSGDSGWSSVNPVEDYVRSANEGSEDERYFGYGVCLDREWYDKMAAQLNQTEPIEGLVQANANPAVSSPLEPPSPSPEPDCMFEVQADEDPAPPAAAANPTVTTITTTIVATTITQQTTTARTPSSSTTTVITRGVSASPHRRESSAATSNTNSNNGNYAPPPLSVIGFSAGAASPIKKGPALTHANQTTSTGGRLLDAIVTPSRLRDICLKAEAMPIPSSVSSSSSNLKAVARVAEDSASPTDVNRFIFPRWAEWDEGKRPIRPIVDVVRVRERLVTACLRRGGWMVGRIILCPTENHPAAGALHRHSILVATPPAEHLSRSGSSASPTSRNSPTTAGRSTLCLRGGPGSPLINTPKPKPQRYVIDFHFKDLFEVARPTDKFRQFMESYPAVFTGTETELQTAIHTLCSNAIQSLNEQDMAVPPWRRAEFLQHWFAVAVTNCRLDSNASAARRRASGNPSTSDSSDVSSEMEDEYVDEYDDDEGPGQICRSPVCDYSSGDDITAANGGERFSLDEVKKRLSGASPSQNTNNSNASMGVMGMASSRFNPMLKASDQLCDMAGSSSVGAVGAGGGGGGGFGALLLGAVNATKDVGQAPNVSATTNATGGTFPTTGFSNAALAFAAVAGLGGPAAPVAPPTAPLGGHGRKTSVSSGSQSGIGVSGGLAPPRVTTPTSVRSNHSSTYDPQSPASSPNKTTDAGEKRRRKRESASSSTTHRHRTSAAATHHPLADTTTATTISTTCSSSVSSSSQFQFEKEDVPVFSPAPADFSSGLQMQLKQCEWINSLSPVIPFD